VHRNWFLAFRNGEVAHEVGYLFCVLQGENCSTEGVLEGDDTCRWEVNFSIVLDPFSSLLMSFQLEGYTDYFHQR
jgi:DNA-directed RNA polymerase subunit E'/Rpb7